MTDNPQQWLWFALGFGPAISILAGVIGGLIVGLYIHKVVLPKLKHITEMTNSTYKAAQEKIESLQHELSTLKDALEKRLAINDKED